MMQLIISKKNRFYFSYEIGGSASLHVVARMEGGSFSYINGEADSTVWPGWCVHLNHHPLSLVILLICTCRQYWGSSHYSGCQCCEDVGVCIHDNPNHSWSDIVHDLPPI